MYRTRGREGDLIEVAAPKEATARNIFLQESRDLLKLARRHSGRGKHQVLERPPTAGRLVRLCQRTLDALPRLKQVGFGGDNDTCLLRGLTGVSRPETATRLQNVVCRV